MSDKEKGRKEYIKELYDEQIIISHKLKDLLKRKKEIETFLYWFADEEDISKIELELNLTNKNY